MSQDNLAKMFPSRIARLSTSVQFVSNHHIHQPQPTVVKQLLDVLHQSQPAVGVDNLQGIAGLYCHHHSNNNAIQVLFIVFIYFFPTNHNRMLDKSFMSKKNSI